MGQARDGLLDQAKQAGTEKLELVKERPRPSSESQRPSTEAQRPSTEAQRPAAETQRPAEKESFDSTKWPASTRAVP